MPKQLVPVANKPVLVHCLEALRDAGLRQVGMIVGTTGRDIRAEVGDGSQFGLEVTYLPQERPLGLAHCVSVARDFLGDDDFVMYLGDNILVGGITTLTEQFMAQRPSAQVVVTRVPDPREYGVAEVGPDGWVTALVEKPAQPRSDLALIGVYFFTPEIHQAVAAIEPSRRGEYEITDAIEWLVRAGRPVAASVFNGYWKDTGRIQDVLECNRVLLERVQPRLDGDVDTTSELIGPVVVEPGAKIVRSRVVGPAVVGVNCVVEDSFVGPYTALSRECLLSGAGVEYSILLDGATVNQVQGIHGSIIGRNAHVRSVPDTSRHRLVLGDHTQVEIVAPQSW